MFEQISVFDLLGQSEAESRLTYECKRGSGFEGGKVRIFCASLNLGVKELSVYLKDEYGTGGRSADFPDGGRGFTDYNSSGLIIREWQSEQTERYTWQDVAREVKRLIVRNEYLTEAEMQRTKEICSRNGGPAPTPIPRTRIEAVLP